MRIRRLLKSFINWLVIIPIINIILTLIGKDYSVGSKLTMIRVNHKSRRILYGIGALIQIISYGFFMIGLIITIYFWLTGKKSIAERIAGVEQKAF